MKSTKYSTTIVPLPHYGDICTNVENGKENAVLEDLSIIQGRVADDEDGSLLEAVAISSYLGAEDLAIEIAKKIDPTTVADEKHYTLLWDVANPRKAKTFEALIDLGFKGSAFASEAQSGDVLYQILSQAVDKTTPDLHNADVRMIRKLLKTGTIQGFTEESVIEETLRNMENEDFPLRSLRNSNTLPVKEATLEEEKDTIISKESESATKQIDELDTTPVAQSLTKRQASKQFNTGKSLGGESNEEGKGGCGSCIII